MTERNTGGPAFPTESYDVERKTMVREEGMTLRDYFAAKAISAVMATPWLQHISSQMGSAEYAGELATECYAIADAMLKARQK